MTLIEQLKIVRLTEPDKPSQEALDAAIVELGNAQHFKGAYSRALNYVCERHFSGIQSKPGDDPFFASPDGNYCAVDVLIAELEKVRQP